MDRKTRDARRRAKAENGRRGELPESTPFGYGRKGRVERFPPKRCEFVDGGKRTMIWKRRPDNTKYGFEMIVGGHRCPKAALTKGRCLEHVSS